MKKVRYAVIGAGWISQEAFLPAVEQTGNSEVTAIVSGDLAKAKQLADFYGIEGVYAYEQFDAMARQESLPERSFEQWRWWQRQRSAGRSAATSSEWISWV